MSGASLTLKKKCPAKAEDLNRIFFGNFTYFLTDFLHFCYFRMR